MSTPLFSAVNAYTDKNPARFHMPGHKGRLAAFGRLASLDITEVVGCDELYRPRSAIAELEARYAHLYKSDASLLCAGGASLCIQTMLAVALNPGDKLICGRGCHVSAVNAMALLDIDPCWVFPEIDHTTGLCRAISPAQIESALSKRPDASAVYITSPDYYGAIADVRAISDVCNAYGVPLLVDNAHGAHLRFLNPSAHPVNLGAAMCCDSLHKTLPVLTGGAMLHIKGRSFADNAKRHMSLFGSTSPSYLIMLSADLALESLETDFPQKLQAVVGKIASLEKLATNRGFIVPQSTRDPARLVLGFFAMGYESGEFSSLLRKSGIEPEMTDDCFCVLMASPHNTQSDFLRLQEFIESLPLKAPFPARVACFPPPQMVMRLRDAVFSETTEVTLQNSPGRIAGAMVSPCPPGVPIVMPGELIDKKLLPHFKKYGISRINVLK